MPAARPRMHVTPSESTYRLLQEVSRLTGKPPATIVRELLDEAAPALEATVAALTMLKTRPREAQAAINRYAAQAMTQLGQAQLDLDTAMQKKPGRKKGGGAAKPG